jgi:myosin-crossreactive antigen
MDLYQQRGESVHAAQHVHSKAEIVDLRPDDEQFVIAGKMFGG